MDSYAFVVLPNAWWKTPCSKKHRRALCCPILPTVKTFSLASYGAPLRWLCLGEGLCSPSASRWNKCTVYIRVVVRRRVAREVTLCRRRRVFCSWNTKLVSTNTFKIDPKISCTLTTGCVTHTFLSQLIWCWYFYTFSLNWYRTQLSALILGTSAV